MQFHKHQILFAKKTTFQKQKSKTTKKENIKIETKTKFLIQNDFLRKTIF